jgi:hypothetical protein
MQLPADARVLCPGVALVGDQLIISPGQFRRDLPPEIASHLSSAALVSLVYGCAMFAFGAKGFRSLVQVKTDLVGGAKE